jgi:hypothetical protein
MSRRWSRRGQEALDALLAQVNDVDLETRLAESAELDALLVRAVNAAAASGLESKRRLLGRIVAQAVLDDAEIDESSLVVDTLVQIDAAHVRCLTAIARAEAEAQRLGEQEPIARGAEKPHTQRVSRVAETYPYPLLDALRRLGLIDASISWDGVSRVTGMTKFGELLLKELRRSTEE